MNEIAGEILAILRRYLSEPTSRSLLTSAARRANVRLEALSRNDIPALVQQLGPGLNIFLQEPEKLQNCKSLLALVAVDNAPPMMSPPEQPVESRPDGFSVPIRAEHDIVRARTLGKDMAMQLGFSEVV